MISGEGTQATKTLIMATALLTEAFHKLSELPDSEQDAIALHMIELFEAFMSDEKQWETTFARSLDTLDKLAEEALAEHRAGHTEPLDPDKL